MAGHTCRRVRIVALVLLTTSMATWLVHVSNDQTVVAAPPLPARQLDAKRNPVRSAPARAAQPVPARQPNGERQPIRPVPAFARPILAERAPSARRRGRWRGDSGDGSRCLRDRGRKWWDWRGTGREPGGCQRDSRRTRGTAWRHRAQAYVTSWEPGPGCRRSPVKSTTGWLNFQRTSFLPLHTTTRYDGRDNRCRTMVITVGDRGGDAGRDRQVSHVDEPPFPRGGSRPPSGRRQRRRNGR